MALQSLIGFIYGVIQQTWIVSAMTLKYVLAVQLFYAIREDGDLFENFNSEVEEYSREIVTLLVMIGALIYITGIELSATAPVFSYLIALVYFGYLFWQF